MRSIRSNERVYVKVFENENVAMFDIDETLIHHIELTPHDMVCDENLVEKFFDKRINEYIYFEKNLTHIRLLKQMKGRDKLIFVWSAAGYSYAADIVKHLKLEKYVDVVMTKPGCYIDDTDFNKYCQKVFLTPQK